MNEHDHQRVEKVGPWTFQRVMLLLNDYDGLSNLVVVPPDFIWIWVEIIDMPPALMAAATPKVVGKNLGFFLLVNQTGIHQGIARVRVSLPLNNPVHLQCRLQVLLADVIEVQFRYERLLGSLPRLCHDEPLWGSMSP